MRPAHRDGQESHRAVVEKETRNAIERATQRARKLLEEDFGAQLEAHGMVRLGEDRAVDLAMSRRIVEACL